MIEGNKIYLGDCLDKLKDMEDNSIDLIVTDPPFGISFMGKEWDKAVPSVDTWKECLRVLKDGAFAFIMCIPRQDCLARMICNLGDAGFNTNFTSIYWTYASGFPKAGNIGKMVDKRLGGKRKVIDIYKFPDGKIRKTDRTYSSKVQQLHGNKHTPITKPASKEAKQLDGSYSGYQPKPAVEAILVAMKPLSEKTYVDQAMKNGKGCTWLDDCRVPYESEKDNNRKENKEKSNSIGYNSNNWQKSGERNNQGRFPANLICSDDVLNDGKEHEGKVGFEATSSSIYGNEMVKKTYCSGKAQYGSYSRYFDLDAWWAKTFPFLIVPKASKSEKNKGCGEKYELKDNVSNEIREEIVKYL